MTLSVGDGANDVPMILEASVGVGISGNEGMQAVRSADYAIAQFRFLKVLLLFHGRANYNRVSTIVLYSLYKNCVLVSSMLCYGAYTGWTGTALYDSMMIAGFNVFWSGFGIIVNGTIDRDVSAKAAIAYPQLYIAGQRQEGFNLKKPSAYHWDFLLLALMTLLCGLLGLPPVNGVIPQAPMHSRSNSVWRRGNGKETEEEAKFGDADFYIRENRVSNMLQSVLCGVCLLITPVLQQIPRSVLWGFFAFMALEGLPGNQFFRRIKLFVTDSTRVQNLLDDPAHESYLDTVPMPVILKFTACQLAGLLICYGITWAGIVGISFPLFIMILVPAREYLLPKFFANEHLQELDPLDLSEVFPPPSFRPYMHTRCESRGNVSSCV